MMKYIPLILAIFLFACKNKQQEPQTPASGGQEESELPEGFAEFYQKFHSDSLYQVEHIVFPLEGLPDNADSAIIAEKTFRWEAENWKMQRPIDFEMSEFQREIIPLNNLIVLERIVHRNGEFGMVRRFAKVSGEWHLIYYAGVNRLAR